ncbi:MAG: LD-carboxypeptidase [Thermoplasmata archaeon]|nr:LD-carboxypeptidase [Thermoplasmata archaeon]
MSRPALLRRGSGVRVVAPSRSLSIVAPAVRAIALRRYSEMGLEVSFGRHVEESDAFGSTSVKHRVEDLVRAFEDPSVELLHTVIGGFNVNQLLRELPYRTIERNPKALCGYSDITALQLAIHAKTGLISFSGPHYATFGMLRGFEYIRDQFHRALFDRGSFELPASSRWSADPWYRDQVHRHFRANRGPWVVQPGRARGRLLGGNLCTLNLLQGTEFLPDLEGSVLFVEDCDDDGTPVYFDRNLQSVLHLPSARGLRGLVIGRFQPKAKMTRKLLQAIVRSKSELEGLPVVADVDFGHTYPMCTFPIGGRVELEARGGRVRLTLSAT